MASDGSDPRRHTGVRLGLHEETEDTETNLNLRDESAKFFSGMLGTTYLLNTIRKRKKLWHK